MKRRLISFVSFIMALCVAMPVTTFAANETSMQTNLVHVVRDTRQAIYEVDIPAEIIIDDVATMPLALSYNALEEDEYVSVHFNGTASLDQFDGCVHLTSPATDDIKRVMAFMRWSNNGDWERISAAGTTEVARFSKDGNIYRYDALVFQALDEGKIETAENFV